MQAKHLIKQLKRVAPDTQVILWNWTSRGDRFQDLAPTLKPTSETGCFVLTVNNGIPPTKNPQDIIYGSGLDTKSMRDLASMVLDGDADKEQINALANSVLRRIQEE